MPNENNLTPFTSETTPAGPRTSRKGIPNRATILKKFLKMKIEIDDPAKIGEKLKVSLYEAAALGQILAAMDGNTASWREIQDSLFGRLTDKTELTGPGGEPIQTAATFIIIKGVSGSDPPDAI